MSALAHAASRAISSPMDGVRAIAAGLRIAAILTLAAVLLAGAYLTWGRDIPIFKVSSVEVVGTDDGLIVSTLTGAARTMTTLHVREERFEQIAAQFPAVSSVHAEPDFPTGMRLEVEVREPVAVVKLDERAMPVAADATLLPGVHVSGKVPTIEAEAKGQVVVGEAVDQLRVVGATPGPLLELVRGIETRQEGGIVIELEGGVEVRFGTPTSAERKWASTAAVLADDSLSGLSYVDVSAPQRPSVGGAIGGPEIAVEVEVAPIDGVAVTPDPATTAPPVDPAVEEAAVDPATGALPVDPAADPAVAVP